MKILKKLFKIVTVIGIVCCILSTQSFAALETGVKVDTDTPTEPPVIEEKESLVPKVAEDPEDIITPEVPQASEKKEANTFAVTPTAVATDAKYFIFEGGTITGYGSDGPKDVVIPETYVKDGTTINITAIAEKAFAGMQLTGIVFNTQITSIGAEGFRNNPLIQTAELPSGLTAVNNYLFAGCTGLTTVTVPTGITEIGTSAFQDCSSLKTVNLPTTVTKINSYAFYDCKVLNTIDLTNVTFFSNSAFYRCYKLPNFTFNEETTYIGSQTFQECSSLTTIVLPKKLTSLSSYAFYNCYGVTSITLNENLKSIDYYTFYSCYRLQTINIPASVTIIDDRAFSSCSALKNVTFEANSQLKSIGMLAFSSCSIGEITIPKTVTTIKDRAFNENTNIKIHLEDFTVDQITGSPWGATNPSVYWGSTDTSCFYIGSSGTLLGFKPVGHDGCTTPDAHTSTTLDIPAKIGEQQVTSIGTTAFKSFTRLETVSIPSSVTTINSFAFNGCTNLKNVTFSEGLTTIGDYAFTNNALVSITLPNSLRTVGQYVFYSCSKLEEVYFGTGIATIGEFSFSSIVTGAKVHLESKINGSVAGAPWGGTSLNIYWQDTNANTSCFSVSAAGLLSGLKPADHSGCLDPTIHTTKKVLKIPEYAGNTKITSIASRAFIANQRFTDIIIPDTVTTIQDRAFYNCDALVNLKLGSGLKTVGEYAFSSCDVLPKVVLPDSLTYIYAYMFEYCSSLKEVEFGANVTSISTRAFYNTKMTTLALPETLTGIGSEAFAFNSNLQGVVIPDSVTSIGSSSFANCGSMKYVTLGKKLTSINSSAFLNTPLKEVNIPSTITYIPIGTFPLSVEKIFVDAIRKNFVPSVNQPWGAQNAQVKYRGEFIEGKATVAYNLDYSKAIISVYCKAEDAAATIRSIKKPDGTMIDFINKNEHTAEFEITKPGSYTYEVVSTGGTSRSFTVVVDRLDPIFLEGYDFLLDGPRKESLTEEKLINYAAGQGYMKDAPETDLPITISPNLDTIKAALTNDEDKVKVTLSAKGTMAGDTTGVIYSAQKTIWISYSAKNFYEVKFVDYDDKLIEKQDVIEGEDALSINSPKREGYTFTGWDKSYKNIQADTTVKAQYRLLPKWTGRTEIDIPLNTTFVASEHVRAVDGDGGALTASASGTVDITKVGKYEVTYTMKDKWGGIATQLVTFNVKEKVVTNAAKKETISGKSAVVTLAELSTAMDSGTAAVKTLLTKEGEIAAETTDNGTELDFTLDTSTLVKNKGKYEYTVKTSTNNTSLTLTLQVYNYKNVTRGMDGLDAYADLIYANDFSISAIDSTTITAQKAVELANANAIDLIPSSAVAVNVEDITAIQNKERGIAVYPLTFTTVHGAKVTVNVKVVDKHALDSTKKEYLTGNDIYVKMSEIATLDDAKIKAMSNISAVKLSGEDITYTITKNLQEIKGSQNITFTTAAGTKLVLQVHVFDYTESNGGETLYANDIAISESEATGITAATLMKLANAKAFEDSTGNVRTVSVENISAVQNQKRGTYSLTYKTDLNNKVTTTVTIRGKTANTGITRVVGNDFSIGIAEIPTKDSDLDTLLITRGMVKANEEGGKVVDVVVKDKSALQKKAGVYSVIFKSDNDDETALTLQVTVQESGNINEANKETISANDIQIAKDQVAGILSDNTKLIALAGARAVNTKTGATVAVSVESTTIKAVKGVYAATFKTAEGTKQTIKITVQDGGSTNTSTNENISANDFKISLDDYVTAISDGTVNTVLISKANVRANDLTTGNLVTATVKTNNMVAKKGIYTVIFTTAKGTQATVQATIVDEVAGSETEAIYANDFSISETEAGSVTNDKLIQWANAYSENPMTGIKGSVTVKTHTVVASAGVYKVTFKTASNIEITVTATVKKAGTSSTTNQESISANDMHIAISEIATANNDVYIKRAGVVARDDNGYEVAVTNITKNILEKRGSYSITFATQKGTAVTVTAYVEDVVVESNSTKEIIKANHFKISSSEVSSVSEARLISLATAKGYDLDSGKGIEVKVIKNNLKEKIGTYTITFETPNKTQATVNVTVTGSSGQNPGNTEEIYANPFSVAISDKPETLTDEKLITLARADATVIATGEKPAIIVESTLKNKKGIYDVTFKTANGASIVVKGTVTEVASSDNENATKTDAIYASDFSLSVQEALVVTEADLVSMAKATAYEKATGAPVVVTVPTITSVQGKGQGRYSVLFRSANGSQITVLATVTKNSGTVPEGIRERIVANDFSIDISKVENGITATEMIALAKASAVNIDTNIALEMTVTSELKAKKGTYDVTFSTAQGATITVKATVIENGVPGNETPSVLHTIYANDFSLSVDEAKNIEAKTIIALANAKAYEKVSGAPVEVTVQANILYGKPQGNYQVTFSAQDAEITVTANITKSHGGNSDSSIKERIVANDFTVKTTEVAGLSDKDIITLAKANAENTETSERLVVKVTSGMVAKKGTYDVTFSTTNNTTITVQATVVESSIENADYAIYANDFSLSVEEAKTITGDTMKQLANAKAYEKVSGAPIEVNTDNAQLLNKGQGNYVVVFTAATTSITVTATITKSGGGNTDAEIKERITANDFTVEIKEVNDDLDSASLITKAKAKATNTQTSEDVVITKVTSKIEAKKGVYDVTFSTTNNTKITVQATVVENGSNKPGALYAIYANDFTLSVEEAKTVDGARLITLAKAIAYEKSSGAPATITVDENVIKGKAQGSYQVTFIAGSESVTVTATISLGSGTATDPVTHETHRISANDFSISVEQMETAQDSDIIMLANAKGNVEETGAALSVSVIQKPETKQGQYDVIFKAGQATITVKGTVTSNSSEDNADNNKADYIYANDFFLSEEEAENIDMNKLITLASARAFDKVSGAPVSVSTDITAIKTKKQGKYPVKFSSANGSSIEVTATITKGVVTNPDLNIKERITANDFTVESNKVKSITTEEIISLAKAQANHTETGQKIDIFVTGSLQEAVGSYEITFSTANATSITVQGNVTTSSSSDNTDSSKKDYIYANDFSLSVEETKNIEEKTVIELAKARASDKESGTVVAVKVININDITDKPQGVYKVVFESTNGSRVEVKATVTKNSGTVQPGVKERITANDFSISVAEVGKTELDKELIKLAKAKAINTDTGTEVEIIVDKTKLQDTKGVYEVTFSTAKKTTITVKATVVENSSTGNTDPTISHNIYANHFILSEEEAKGVSKETLIELAKAYATDKETGAIVDIDVDTSSVNNKPQGMYEVTFSTSCTSISVKATITKNSSTNEDPNIKEKISANDFVMEEKEVAKVTDEKLITLAKAHAVDTKTGSNIEVLVDKTKLKGTKGVYEVTFSTAKKTTITVKVTVVNSGSTGNTDPTISHNIYANHFILSEKEAKGVSKETLIALAKAYATDKETGAIVDVDVDTSSVDSKPQGMYYVTFSTSCTSMRVKATITKNSSTNEDVSIKERITANDVWLSSKEAKNISDEALIALAKVEAINYETGQSLGVAVEENTVKGKGVGRYEITFKTEKGTSITVNVTVMEEGIIDEQNKESITAQNFAVKKEEVKELTNAKIISLSKAKAIDLLSGKELELEVSGNVKAEGGEYKNILSTKKGTTLTITILVKEEAKENPIVETKDSLASKTRNPLIVETQEVFPNLVTKEDVNKTENKNQTSRKEETTPIWKQIRIPILIIICTGLFIAMAKFRGKKKQ